MREDSRERQEPIRERHAPHGPREPASIVGGELYRLGRGSLPDTALRDPFVWNRRRLGKPARIAEISEKLIPRFARDDRGSGDVGFDKAGKVGNLACRSKDGFVNSSFEPLLEVHHQLDAIERTEAQFIECRLGRDGPAGRIFLKDGFEVAGGPGAGITTTFGDRLSNFSAPQLAGGLRAWEIGIAPDVSPDRK